MAMVLENYCECEVEVQNSMGLHARPATLLVQRASAFKSDISVNKSGEIVDCKSILGLMMLSAGCGTRLKISASGCDSEAAIAAIRELFEHKFEED